MPRRSKVLAVVLVIVATLAVLVPSTGAPATSAPAVTHTATHHGTHHAARRATYTPPPEALFFSNPKRHPRGITDQLLRLIRNAHRHSAIEVSTYFLGSALIEKALVAAHRRGVRVRVILTRGTRSQYAAGRALARALNHNRHDTSWLRWAAGSARGTRGIDHQKIYRFSRVGQRRWITVVGSMNSSSRADVSAYSQMLLVSRKSVFDWFRWNFKEARADRPVRPNPLRQIHRPGWNAYVFPTTAHRPSADPVMQRLRAIPANGRTFVRIAMYSMWDDRGIWIAERLAWMRRHGAHVQVIVGPGVASGIVSILRDGGVAVHGGCYRDGTYTHDKDWTATYRRGGRIHRWTWIGSDNWTSRGQDNDEAVLGVDDARIQRQFLYHFRPMWSRPGAVLPDRCDPRHG